MPHPFAFTEFVPHKCGNSCISTSAGAGALLIFMPGKQSTEESKCLPSAGLGTPASIQHLAMFGGQASRLIRERIDFSAALPPDCRRTALCLLPALCFSSFNDFQIRDHLSSLLLHFCGFSSHLSRAAGGVDVV